MSADPILDPPTRPTTVMQYEAVVEAARRLLRHSVSGDMLGRRIHRGEDEWELLGALNPEDEGPGPAIRKLGRPPDSAVKMRRELARILAAEGVPFDEIAERFGVHPMTIRRYLNGGD